MRSHASRTARGMCLVLTTLLLLALGASVCGCSTEGGDSEGSSGSNASSRPLDEIIADIDFGTQDAQRQALRDLTSMDGPGVTDALGHYLAVAGEQRSIRTSEVQSVLAYLSEKPRPYSSELFSQLLGSFGFRPRLGECEWVVNADTYERMSKNSRPQSLSRALASMGTQVDQMLVTMATGAYLYEYKEVGGYERKFKTKSMHLPGLTEDVVQSTICTCPRERADRIIASIVRRFYVEGGRHPMDEAVLYVGGVGRGGECLVQCVGTLESVARDALTVDEDGMSNDRRWDMQRTERGFVHDYDVIDGLLPVLWALLNCESPVALECARTLAETHPDHDELAQFLAACGDRTLGDVVDRLLRSGDPAVRLRTVQCVLRGGSPPDDTLRLLRYMADNDTDLDVRSAISEGL